MENGQVVLDLAAGSTFLEQVVGHAEPTGGEHRIAISVLLEGAGLADEPVNDMSIFNAMPAPTLESRQSVEFLRPVSDLQGLGAEVNINAFADQSAGKRVGIAAEMDRAPGIDPGLDPPGHLDPARRQMRKSREFLLKTRSSVGISPVPERLGEALIIVASGEVAAAAKHQGLINRLLEAMRTLLDVAVLIGLTRLNRLAFDLVVRE